MKILELGKFYPPVRGGIETLLKSLCDGFVRKGDEVECVLANDRNATVEEQIEGVRVRRMRSFGQALSTSLCPGYVGAALSAKADLWHTHFPNPLADLAILRAPTRTRIVITYHSDIVRQAGMMRLYGPVVRRCLARANKIVVASPRHLEFSKWLQPHRDKTVIFPFGIDVARFEKPRMLPEGMVKPPGPILLTVGRLVGYKGHRWLIEAVKGLQATLWIVGTGPLEAELRRQADEAGLKERIHFLGNVSDEDLPAFYQVCDIFALPSVTPNEAFGVAQIEAMACGKPVISCALESGVPWVNQNNVTGLVVPPRDAQAMAGAVRTLLEDPTLRRQLGERGRVRVASEFTEAKMIDRYYSLFREQTG